MANRTNIISRGGVTLQDPSFLEGLYKSAGKLTDPQFWVDYEAQKKYEDRQTAKALLDQQRFIETKDITDKQQAISQAQNQRAIAQEARNVETFNINKANQKTQKAMSEFNITFNTFNNPDDALTYLDSFIAQTSNPDVTRNLKGKREAIASNNRDIKNRVSFLKEMYPGLPFSDSDMRTLVRDDNYDDIAKLAFHDIIDKDTELDEREFEIYKMKWKAIYKRFDTSISPADKLKIQEELNALDFSFTKKDINHNPKADGELNDDKSLISVSDGSGGFVWEDNPNFLPSFEEEGFDSGNFQDDGVPTNVDWSEIFIGDEGRAKQKADKKQAIIDQKIKDEEDLYEAIREWGISKKDAIRVQEQTIEQADYEADYNRLKSLRRRFLDKKKMLPILAQIESGRDGSLAINRDNPDGSTDYGRWQINSKWLDSNSKYSTLADGGKNSTYQAIQNLMKERVKNWDSLSSEQRGKKAMSPKINKAIAEIIFTKFGVDAWSSSDKAIKLYKKRYKR
jgi:hypothetical protein